MKSWTHAITLAVAALATAALLPGCGGGSNEDPNSTARRMTVNSPARIAQTSADNYDDNVNGLITGATLRRWMSNWPAERPAGITGKLVIFQASAGPVGAEYIKPDGVNVFTYLSPSSEWIQTRNNGVIETQSMVPDGASMDALMRKFNIDPTRDMIVAAMGTGNTGNAMAQGRIWYALRYWGVDQAHLAVLNGGNQWLVTDSMTAAQFQATASTAPNNGTFSIKSLLVDNTQLQATVRDLLAVLPSTNVSVKSDGMFLWDARSVGQYAAGTLVERGEDTNSDTAGNQSCTTAYCMPVNPDNYRWTFQNGGSRQGHPFGAVQLQYTHMLDSTKGFAYKPKAVLASYLDGTPDATGIGFIDGTMGLLGAGNAYQEGDTIYVYCETTFRAMITGVVSAVILGKPTRFYDGAMVEWNSLSHITDNTGRSIMPADSPWRTDVRSYFRAAMATTDVATRNVTNPYAAHTDAIVNADKTFKTGESAGDGGGGGGLPPNPCGG
jgi:3-mercaptopyruvate sulfurtransferase SseA